MAKSVPNLKQARVQRVCTLWTHDENLTRDEIVFNGEKFPELPTAPGSLLRIVAINPNKPIRNLQSANKSAHDIGGRDTGTDIHSKRSRRGSITVTIDENGSPIPDGRDIDTEKAYVFVAKPFPADVKSKYPNLQVSLCERIAKVFGFRNRMQVILTEADEDKHEAHHVELVFRDEYLARADMWRMAASELSKRTVYRNQKLLFMGTIKATIKHIYINGQPVHSGYFSPKTKPVFRSESARYVLFIQMSREMWDFDAEGAGEIMFNKVVGGFLPDLFKRWLKINARHLVTIILFTRMQYDGDLLSDRPSDTTSSVDPETGSSTFRDYYRVVVSDMASGDWINILYQLKKEFRTFLQEVSIIPRTTKDKEFQESTMFSTSISNTIVAGKPSSASQGNILEAINLAAAQFAKDYIDRDLVRTGISVIVVTPGTGVFEVDYNMLKLTTDTLIGSGIGIDLVCLSPMPLHSVPLFKYRTPRLVSDLKVEGKQSRQDDHTPRQYQSHFDSILGTPNLQVHRLAHGGAASLSDISDDWRYAMPYWVDVSFWSGTSEEILELTKPRKADKILKKTRKKGRIFALRCRLYELQMMGVVENDLGDISLPYLEEDPIYPHQLRHTFESSHESGRERISLPKASTPATGSYSSRGDKGDMNGPLDEITATQKAWMEKYDNILFSPVIKNMLAQDHLHAQLKNQDGRGLRESPELSRGSYLSISFRSGGRSFENTARPPPDSSFHQLVRGQQRDFGGRTFQGDGSGSSFENKDQSPRGTFVLQHRKSSARSTLEQSRPHLHRRVGSRDSDKYQKTPRSPPKHSPAPSRRSSPPRHVGNPSESNTITPWPIKADLKGRPSNWFLRQISFGGKVAAAKLTTGDATIDISHGNVKPAMLTVEKNQKGAIAERLASTRLTITEKPSQPIAIRVAPRAGQQSTESLSSERVSHSAERERGVRPGRSSVPSHPSSIAKDPGSTFLLAGTRALGDHVGPKPDLSSSGGAREVPQTLSPTSAIAPWAVLVNPCNPKKNSFDSTNQYRRWHHVFPRALRTGTVKWRSLCSPAAVPLTHEWFPSADQLATEYNESPYKIIQNDDDDVLEAPKSRESLIKELIGFRLSHGFQIIVGSSVATSSGRSEKSLASILAPEYMSTDGDTIFMSVGSNIHQLVCVAGGEVEVRRYNRKPTTILASTAGIDTPFPYRPYIRTAFEPTYEARDVVLRPSANEYNWNFIDTFLAGYHDEFSDILRFWRARFVLIPVELPTVNRRPLAMLTEDSDEEVRLEGIRKLTQLWQKFRYVSPEERTFPISLSTKQKDPNPLAIEYHTRDPSAIIAAGPTQALFTDTDSEFPSSLFSDAEKYQRSNIDIKKLAEDLQGEKGIRMLDRRWHWKLHYNCFLGFDLTNWLLSNFKDMETRDEAIELGNELMSKGLFHHVQKRHPFRDGNFFFQIAAEYRTPRPESRMSWFGMRKTDKSVPATPITEAPRMIPLASKSMKSRPTTADSSSSNSGSLQEGEKTPTRAGTPKRMVTLSRAMRYDVDPRKRSYRPEIISLHYDRLHNPDNCYHIRIDWMNVTAKLIDDAIVTWATSVEKYGLKLVEVPIAEVATIVDDHPFRSPYTVKLAKQPPEHQPEALWDPAHLSPQFVKTDRFMYHKALLRKLNFVLDVEAASTFPSDVEVKYSWGNPDYKHTQFIHRSGTVLAQITDDGNFLLLANRLAHNRAKDNSRIRQVDPYEHKRATTDGTQSSRLPSTPAERANPHRSPFSSPLARPVQDSSLLHASLGMHEKPLPTPTANTNAAQLRPEQVREEVERFCTNPNVLSAFYSEAFKQAPSPSPYLLPVLDEKIPSLGLPPAISIREASPANNTGWALSSTLIGRGERGFISGLSDIQIAAPSSIAGRRQGSDGSASTLGKRGSIWEANAESQPGRQDSQEGQGGGS